MDQFIVDFSLFLWFLTVKKKQNSITSVSYSTEKMKKLNMLRVLTQRQLQKRQLEELAGRATQVKTFNNKGACRAF